MAYVAPDFYGIDDLLTDDERMIRDTVRDWVSDRVVPVIGDRRAGGRNCERREPP